MQLQGKHASPSRHLFVRTLWDTLAAVLTSCCYLQIYERDVMFRQQVGNLQLIVGIYNNVQATILPVEKPLITQKLEAVDAALKKGLQVCSGSCPVQPCIN